MNNKKLLILVFLGLNIVSRETLSQTEVANLLGFAPTDTNLCGGYYQEPAIVLSCKDPADLDASPTTITAEKSVSFSATDTSQLEGHVIVTQPGRKMTADKAVLFRDPQDHDISQILLVGNVHYYEAGKHLVSNQVFVDLKKKYVEVNDGLYRLARPHRGQVLNAWGRAKTFIKKSEKEIRITEGSYTTCSPINPTWQIVAKKIHIDREAGWGEAINSYLLIHHAPIVWLPYFSFPIDKRRKSGFLFPTASYSSNKGLNVGFPYYFNLAPNYDLTLIPNLIFRRGIQLENHFRYLTENSTGNFGVEYIPYDKLFADFKRNAPYIYGVTPDTRPFLQRLKNSSNSRGWISFTDSTVFNCNWWGSVNLNYVTDDYYLQDFADNPFRSSIDQLLNQAEINYASNYWRFIGRVQTYQTLHPINQQPVLSLYSKLPQLMLISDYPELPFHFNYQLNSELTNFVRPENFLTEQTYQDCSRIHLGPSLDFPFIYPSFFLIPKFSLDATLYNFKNFSKLSRESRVLPIYDVDTGLYLERETGNNYLQTLEPRLFYLFVPRTNQNAIPIFDTVLPPFSFAQLFRTNRFVGYDRQGDANQLSYALTTRFLNRHNGEQKLGASIGQTLYFTPPKVCLTSDCNNDYYYNQTLSPLVGEINFFFTPAWEMVASTAFGPFDQGLNTASLVINFRPSCKHIFNVGYDFVRKGDTLTTYKLNSSENNLNRVYFALAWQLNDHWQAVGNLNYNLSHGHPQAYFYGLQYDSCCYALRFVASRIITAEDMNDRGTYQTNIYIQLQLKGLGNVGNSDPGSLLTSSILGYHDTFKD